LVTALRWLLSEEELRQEMGRRAQQWVRRHRSKEQMIDQLAQLYQMEKPRKKGSE
jgi:glycosyltransferase involved in cell wall biosynthesis